MAVCCLKRTVNISALICVWTFLLLHNLSLSAPQNGKIVAFFQGSCESSLPNPCQHQCTNIHSGGFYCLCNEGYSINKDGMTCAEADYKVPSQAGDSKDAHGEINVDNSQVVKIQSFDLKKGLAPLESSAHTRLLKTDSSLILDRGFYNILEGGADDYGVICDGHVCQNNGTCTVMQFRVSCQCPFGTGGEYCQQEVEVKYPKFSGTGYLSLPVLPSAGNEFHVSLQFRPESEHGLLLYTGHSLDDMRGIFSVALVYGHIIFRYDCGRGDAEMKSRNKVDLGQWNRLIITRQESRATMKLNEEDEIQAVSKVDFSRTAARVYLGGYSNMPDNVCSASSQRFTGCVQEMEVNGHVLDFRKDGVQGVNVGECSSSVCEGVVCQNGGTCTPQSADQYMCLCPLGFYGESCQQDAPVRVPQFSGSSYLEYPGLQRSVLSYTEIEMAMKPTSLDGTLLYNGYSKDRTGDFVSLSLHAGYLEFRFDLGTGTAVIRSQEPLSLDEWHFIRASRTGLMGTLEVDDQGHVAGQAGGAYTQLTLFDGLYLGGHPNYDHTSKPANLSKSFKGCIQKVKINKKQLQLISSATKGVNISPCSHPCAGQPCLNGGECHPNLDSYSCYCPIGFTNKNCENGHSLLPSRPMFSGESYLMYNEREIVKRVSGTLMDFQMTFRATSREGLIFWSGEDLRLKPSGDFISLGFHGGSLQLHYNLGSGEAVISYNDSRLLDGDWHSVRIQRDKQDAYMEIDKVEVVEGSSPGAYTSLNTDNTVYLGGMPNIAEKTGGRYTSGFSGCVNGLKLATDYDVMLVSQSQEGRNIVQCRRN